MDQTFEKKPNSSKTLTYTSQKSYPRWLFKTLPPKHDFDLRVTKKKCSLFKNFVIRNINKLENRRTPQPRIGNQIWLA